MELSKKYLILKFWDKLIGQSVWVWITATLLLIFGTITNEQWFVVSLTIMGGRVAEGIISPRPMALPTTPTITPTENGTEEQC